MEVLDRLIADLDEIINNWNSGRSEWAFLYGMVTALKTVREANSGIEIFWIDSENFKTFDCSIRQRIEEVENKQREIGR